jgi:hypothetical protein
VCSLYGNNGFSGYKEVGRITMVVNVMLLRAIAAIKPCTRQSNATKSLRLMSNGKPNIADFALVAVVQYPRLRVVTRWSVGARTMEVISNLVVG